VGRRGAVEVRRKWKGGFDGGKVKRRKELREEGM